MEPVLIAVVDPVSRRRLARTLRLVGHVTEEFDCGEAAFERSCQVEPSLVLLQVELPKMCGYDVCHRLRVRLGEALPIVLVSDERTSSCDRVAGLLIGADDCLPINVAADELCARVARLTRNRPAAEPAADSGLTEREREVVELIAAGLSQREIAAQLTISLKTVGAHTEHIFRKLGVHSRAQAVSVAYRDGLLTAPPVQGPVVR